MSALRALLEEIHVLEKDGGRICAHQLEFDAGVILLEMRRVGLQSFEECFKRMAVNGFCTMNPEVTQWACHELVEQNRHHDALGFRMTVGLKDMVRALVPAARALVEQHHDAEVDARMAWLVLHALYGQARLALAGCNGDSCVRSS